MEYISKISNEDNLKIEHILNRFEEYWNHKDVSKMVSLFTEDAEFTDIMGQIALGREKIEKMHEIVFEKVMKKAVLSNHILYIREVASDTVMVTCQWKTVGHTNPQGENMPDRKGMMQIILSSVNGDWLISLVQNFDFTALYNNVDSYNMKFFLI